VLVAPGLIGAARASDLVGVSQQHHELTSRRSGACAVRLVDLHVEACHALVREAFLAWRVAGMPPHGVKRPAGDQHPARVECQQADVLRLNEDVDVAGVHKRAVVERARGIVVWKRSDATRLEVPTTSACRARLGLCTKAMAVATRWRRAAPAPLRAGMGHRTPRRRALAGMPPTQSTRRAAQSPCTARNY